MAIVIPDGVDAGAPPPVRDIYYRLRRSPELRDWLCFHAYSASRQRHRQEADPDFVLLGPSGILVLKVAEGHIKKGSDGGWLQLNRRLSTRPVRLEQGPFKEASAAMSGLRAAMSRVFGKTAGQVRFGWGVMVPDMPVFEDPTEWDADIVFPGLDRLSPIHLYVERLAAYWVRSKPDLRALTREELDKFEDFLRANFEVAPTLGSAVDPGKADMVWFTKQQRNALDLMSEHDHALIGGPAGTGKTFLALEQARRLAARGKRTLLLCHNSLLGDYLGRVVAQPSYKGLVDANAVLNYLFGTIKSSSLYSEFAGEARKSSSAGVYSQYFLKAANEVGVVKYDAMVMDQGNDVLNGDTLFALDYVLQGGFECGAWYVFYDDSTKTDVGEGFVSEVVSHLTSFVPGELHLTLNCRATESIAIHTAAATGFQMACAHTAGEKVKYRWYDDPEGQLEDLKKVVGVLLNDGLAPEEITILYPASQSYLRDGLKETRLRAPVAELGVDCKFPGDRGKIGFASIQAFRGLENRAIVLLGVDRIGEPWADALNYLGMSRARSVLVVFMHRRIRKEYEAQLARVAESGVPLVSD